MNLREPARRLFWAAVRRTRLALGLMEIIGNGFIQWRDCRSGLFTEMQGDKWAAPALMAWPYRIMTYVRQRASEQVQGKVRDFWQSKDLCGCLLFYTWKARRKRRRRSGCWRGMHQSAFNYGFIPKSSINERCKWIDRFGWSGYKISLNRRWKSLRDILSFILWLLWLSYVL